MNSLWKFNFIRKSYKYKNELGGKTLKRLNLILTKQLVGLVTLPVGADFDDVS